MVYGNKCVLKDISVDVIPGKNLCIVGENGAGKSTLAKYFMHWDTHSQSY
jgi:energy-coupling factor transport system ATP-binding protein